MAAWAPESRAGFGRLTSCGGHDRATGFSGYAFVANQDGGAIAAVDLGVFAVARHIRVDGSPTAVLANPRGPRVYALTPENGSVHEIRAGNLTFRAQAAGGCHALEMRLSPAGDALYVLCRKPKQLVRLALNPLQVAWTLPLPDDPTGLRYLARRKHASRSQLRLGLLPHFRRSRQAGSTFRRSAPAAKSAWCDSSRTTAPRARNPIRGS